MLTDNTPSAQQEIIENAAWLLRHVAQGGSTSGDYFWLTLLALEYLRDGNVGEATHFLRTLKKTPRHAS